MKKLFSTILVLGLLLSGNAYAENIEIKKNFIAVNFCKDGAGYSAISYECPTSSTGTKSITTTYEIFLTKVKKPICYSKKEDRVQVRASCQKSREQYEVKNDGKNFYWVSEETQTVKKENTKIDLENLLGLYSGKLIYENSPSLPVVSELKINDRGEVWGQYSYQFENNDYKGSLYEGKLIDNNLKIFWTDDFGEGWLKIKFDEKFDNLNGEWGFIVNNVEKTKEGNWTGIKQAILASKKIEKTTTTKTNSSESNYRELVKKFGSDCESSWSNFFSGYSVGTPEFNQCLNEKKDAAINIAKIEEDKLKIEKEIFITLSPEEKRAYTCSKTFSFKKGSDKFKDCVFKIYAAELEFAKLEVEKQLAEAQLETAKANAEAAQARVQTAKAQGELQKAQIEATKAQAAAARQQAAASNAQAAATKQQSSMSLLMQGLQMLQPPTQAQSLKTTCRWSGGFFNCW
jgi:hypothetical protein